MKVLTSESLLQALDDCARNPDANLGIILGTASNVDEFANEMARQADRGYLKGWKINRGIGAGYAVATSPCGSMMHILAARPELLRGRSFQYILYEDSLEDSLWIVDAKGCERLPTFGEREMEFSEELGDFLGSFKVI